LGYVLNSGFFLPPLMFGEDEVDALILGLRLVAERGDPALERAAGDALAKIIAVLPNEMENVAATSGMLAGPGTTPATHMAIIRQAIRTEQSLRLLYTDKKGVSTERVVWPVALGFFQAAEVLAAWCETRRDFRHFRLDRIAAAENFGKRYPKRRRLLLAEWRLQEGIDVGG
jgi:predicted DNA-binding transcriptional regulator YafY